MPIPTLEGTPSVEAYRRGLRSDEFRKMEEFSAEFLTANRDILAPYAEAWTRDPLHSWSRQWEYPYAWQLIRNHARAAGKEPAGQGMSVLDAGSGVTFFPWLLRRTYPQADIRCCDNNVEWATLYAEIGERCGQSVGFLSRSLEDTGLESKSVDVLYCISVLEHAPNFLEIIDEFSRILRPGGLVVITFDLSLEKGGHLSPAEGDELLSAIHRGLLGGEAAASIPRGADGLLTTDIARTLNRPDLLPWKPPTLRSRLGHLARLRMPPRHPPLLTIYCVGGVTPFP